MIQRFILRHRRAPGDITCLSSLARDLVLQGNGETEVDVLTTAAELWNHNPYLTKLWRGPSHSPQVLHPGTRIINCDYSQGLIDQQRESIHFCRYFHRDFTAQTGLPVELTQPKGDLHLNAHELGNRPVFSRYWLVIPGGKTDFTAKVWHHQYFQQVADGLAARGLKVLLSGANLPGHWHPYIAGDNVIDAVGWGGLRELLCQIYHADGVICGVTAAMHMAAVFDRPCVVIAGGRESWWWEAYVNENTGFGPIASHNVAVPHKYLHTIGQLDCCERVGCLKNKVAKIDKDQNVCTQPIITPGQVVPRCLHEITPRHVLDAVDAYYKDNSLPPIAHTKHDAALMREVERLPPGWYEQPRATRPLVTQQRIRDSLHKHQDPDWDHQKIGGQITAFALLYSSEADDYFEMHSQFFTSLLSTIDLDRVELRIGSNCLGDRSMRLVTSLVDSGIVRKHYAHSENAYKYPVMREMFYDPTTPIQTQWILWFDDDTICDVRPDWLTQLIRTIATHKDPKCKMFGAKHVWRMTQAQQVIFQSRPWHQARPSRNGRGAPSARDRAILFAAGGFWAAEYAAIKAADIPDLGTGLTHNGGDWQIGEQLYQAGYTLEQFNDKKQFVRTSGYPRRGVTMPLIDVKNPML